MGKMAGFIAGFIGMFNQAIAAQWRGGEWWSACGIALLISATVAAVGWMLSELMGSPELKGWAKKELGEFLFTAVIIGTLLITVPLIFGITIALGGQDYFASAKSFLANNVEGNLYNQDFKIANGYMAMFGEYLFLMGTTFDAAEFFAKAAEAVGTGGAALLIPRLSMVGVDIPLFLPLENYLTAPALIITASYTAVLISAAQWQLLDFLEKTAFMFILPLGIVMRSFPLTRQTGSTLIALSIVGFFVYPLSVDLSKAVYDEMRDAPEFKLELPPMPTINAPSGITLISPFEGSWLEDDWSVSWTAAPAGGMYTTSGQCRIWAGADNSQCPANCYTGTAPPTKDERDVCWSGQGGPNKCLFLVSRVDTTFGQEVTLTSSDVVKGVSDNNRIYSFLVDCYDDKGVPVGFLENKFVVGDPCSKKEGPARIECRRKYSTLVAGGGESAGASAFYGGLIQSFVEMGKNFGGAFKEKGFLGILPPYLVAGMFMDLCNRAPAVVFPIALTIFMMVLSAIISLSTFSSISGVLGGETKLPDLFKVA